MVGSGLYGSGFFVSLLVLVVVFVMPVFSHELRQSRSTLIGYWFVITLHELVAFANSFWFTTLGADKDAATFHRIGVELAQSENFYFSFSIGSKFYEQMLGGVYWLFGTSHLLGQQLSILAFSLSCVVLLKIFGQLSLTRYRALVLIVFGSLPTMVLLGAVTLRESYQVLFFMMAVYFGIKLHVRGGLNIYLLALVLSSLFMGLFHKGLILYAFFLTALFLLWALRPEIYLWSIKKLRLAALIAIPILITSIFLISKLNIPGAAFLTALSNMELLDAASTYRENSVVSRATYGVSLNFSSLFTALYSSFLLYIHYLFAPFPWQIRSVLDVYASMEAVSRMILIYFSVKQWRCAYGIQRRLMGLMLVLFFSMSFMWALGTTNYGTAMRHHMLSWWILVLVGLPLLVDRMRHFLFGLPRSSSLHET